MMSQTATLFLVFFFFLLLMAVKPLTFVCSENLTGSIYCNDSSQRVECNLQRRLSNGFPFFVMGMVIAT